MNNRPNSTPFTSIVLFLSLAIFAAACNLPGGELATPGSATEIGEAVAATMTAASQVTPVLPSPTPTEPPPATATATTAPTATVTSMPEAAFNLTGKICYLRGEEVPAMTAYFHETETDQVVELPIQAGQTSYEADLPPGRYQAYAWLPDFSRGGLYSQAVVCGLNTGCDDHSPITFDVPENAMVEGVDLCDWYAGPFTIPYPPGKEPGQVTGAISGALAHPSGSAPELHVVATNLDSGYWYFARTNPGAATYTILDLPPGPYNVVAYEAGGRAGGHADASHQLIAVPVKAGEMTSGIDINDWSAPAGTFPADPTR